jgi:LPS export ABC transporter protein LptC
MTRWQRRARLFIAIFAVGFAVVVVLAFKRGGPVAAPPETAGRTDPNALVESTSGRVIRFNRTRADVTVEYQKQLTYQDGSTKLVGVKVATEERGGRSFVVTGKEGAVGQNDATIDLRGDVRLQASDGLSARTEQATYTTNDGNVRASGPVEFSRGRLSGSGVGMTYDKNQDVLTIFDQAKIRVLPETAGATATEVSSGAATVARREKSIRFERGLKTQRLGQAVQADNGVAYLTADEEHVERVELRGNSSITGTQPAPGALQSLTGRDMDLKYAADGDTLEHATIVGDAVLQLAGEKDTPGRQIASSTLDVTLAPDGMTPVALTGREAVQVTFPADSANAQRTIKSAQLDARGAPQKSLTNAVFTGDVDYRERSATVNRVAKAGVLEVSLKPGMSTMDDAKFTRNARFATQSGLFAVAAVARYLPEKGVLELSGSEPTALRPRITSDEMTVDAVRIDVTLDGPKMKATGDVRSTIQPAKKDQAATDQKAATKMPSMLKGDQPVSVIGDALDYDGSVSKATYTGKAKLWQADTSINAQTLTIDNKEGDLTASGSVATSAMLEQGTKNAKAKERVRTMGTASDFVYEESMRRATYTKDAHLTGPQGDMTAAKIELYLQPSGDAVDRVEAYEKMTLREQNRKTTGTRMTYTADNDTYLVTGMPVAVVDECGGETTGRRLTFVKATDTINVDGNGEIRTQTKGGRCP